jgi:DNA-binding SARP family transcriptional activator
MRYEILGPVRVTVDDRAFFVSAGKVETVLAALLIRAGQVVTIDQLMREIWGEAAPRQAVPALQVYISQLRKFLSRSGQGAKPISTRPPGYQLRLGADEFDLSDFQHLMSLGREYVRQQRYEQAATALSGALSYWRGPVLGRARRGPILEGFVAWLEEARLECVEMLTDVRLMLGRHRELVAELFSLTAEYPLREAFYRQLMLALYRSDRQADALRAYQSARRVLNEELGLEPCRALQDLQRSILMADDELDVRIAV